MKHDFITFTTRKGLDQSIAVDYSDDDIVIIDNVKDLTEPSSARVQMNIITVCTRGRTHALLNGQHVELTENQLLICPPGITLSDFMISPDFEFKAVFLTSRIIQSFLREKVNLWNNVMYVHRMHVLTMDPLDTQFFASFYDMLRLIIDARPDDPYRTDILQSILRGALLGLCSGLEQRLPDVTPVRRTHADSIFDRFLDNLNRHMTMTDTLRPKDYTVEQAASELCVSPKYLSAICKKNSGKTAREWIREQLMEEIRYYLKQTDLSMKQIADRLGFANPSFFGKYVKENFGATPKQFREK